MGNIDVNLSKAVARQFGFESYKKIMELCQDENLNLLEDKEGFQKLFNGYYRIRCNEKWRKEYYKYFESIKSDDTIEYRTIIEELYKRLNGRVEASFSSKMLATIRDDMPVLDSKVLENLSLSIKGIGEKKLDNAIFVYNEICQRYKDYMNTENCNKALKMFDELFPDYSDFSNTKKIDFFLWSLNYEELYNMRIFEGLIKNEQT